MCGVVGLMIKNPSLEPALGTLLVPMVSALSDRGPDSSGIAIYSDQDVFSGSFGPIDLPWKVSLGSDSLVDWESVRAETALRFACDASIKPAGMLINLSEGEIPDLTGYLATEWPDVRVLATGQALQVIKDTGRPEATCERNNVESWSGYLAVAHTRMATESAVTVLHSHPFVPAPDLCIVHNGSFSNYASVRRRLMSDGIEFDSDNDSEVGARFLAARLAGGDDLEEATRWVMKEMDGFFTLVIGSATGMSVVRDAFACKPAVVAETADYVAVASEYRALAHLPSVENADVFEPQPEEVHTWTR
jgi:glutamate synthase domain-containing protein 1